MKYEKQGLTFNKGSPQKNKYLKHEDIKKNGNHFDPFIIA